MEKTLQNNPKKTDVQRCIFETPLGQIFNMGHLWFFWPASSIGHLWKRLSVNFTFHIKVGLVYRHRPINLGLNSRASLPEVCIRLL